MSRRYRSILREFPDASINNVEVLTDRSCDVSDALCKLKYRNGGFLSGLTLWSPQRQEGDTKIVGPAYTVKYAPLDDPTPKHPTHYVRNTLRFFLDDISLTRTTYRSIPFRKAQLCLFLARLRHRMLFMVVSCLPGHRRVKLSAPSSTVDSEICRSSAISIFR